MTTLTRRWATGILALATALCWATAAAAQDRPVAFVHGIKSSHETWAEAASRIQAGLALQAQLPDTDWRAVFPNQALQVQSLLGGLPEGAVAVGHSNGGVVAREWSKLRPLGGLVTLGTPNSGAPLAYNILAWMQFNFLAGDAIRNVYGVFGDCAYYGCDWIEYLYYAGLNVYMGYVQGWLSNSLLELISTVGIEVGVPVLPQMSPYSSYMAGLNSAGNLARETGAITSRVGIISVAHNFYYAGPFRAVWPDDADTIAYYMYLTADSLDYISSLIYAFADPYDDLAYNIADAASDASYYIRSIDSAWCGAVSWPGGGLCYENDTIVPIWSQALPQAPNLVAVEGPVHIRETRESDYFISYALMNFMNIPERMAPPPPPPPPPGGSLQPHSAVRGCSGYSEWAPVYQPNPDSCGIYCSQNGANACEWNEDGSCYAEFGSGCFVQGGFGGWWAVVFNNGGGGTGGTQMQSSSAVRGCSNYVEWPAVYQPDAASCLSYCSQNNANACEWKEDGSCYAEFGSGCFVEGGFGGWSAAVLRG